MIWITAFLLSQSLNDLTHFNRYTELSEINNTLKYEEEYEKISGFLHKINEGTRTIYYMCESLEDSYGMFNYETKPLCKYNMSYINNTEIYVYSIDEKLRHYFHIKKIDFCKSEKIECGELTIILRLFDMINLATKLTENIDNTKDLWTNLKLIDFDDLYTLYLKSLNNIELLSNITLAKQKATLILNREKERLKNIVENDKIYKYRNAMSELVAKPLENSVLFLGKLFGTTTGTILKYSLTEILGIFPYELMILILLFIFSILYLKFK